MNTCNSGYTKSKALQKAKMDYINSDALYKSPAYWANLVLPGDNRYTKIDYLIMDFIPAACICLLLAGLPRRKEKKVDAFHNYL